MVQNLKERLINKRFPFLKIDGTKYSHFYSIPDGWRKRFGIKLCKEIKKVLKSKNIEGYKVSQIKEKWGALRWYDNSNNEELDTIIEKYCKMSLDYCICCGKKTHYNTEGWIAPICKKCAKKTNRKIVRNRKTNELEKV